MENKRRALGKGLEQLFGSENVDLDAFEQNIVDTASNNDEIKQIKLSEVIHINRELILMKKL